MNTFGDFCNFLKTLEITEFKEWLENNWEGKDKQESILRLFAFLKLVNKLNKYTLCSGNFNLFSIEKIIDKKQFFTKFLKDNGDYSDLTCINDNNQRDILVCSSKNLNKYSIGNLGICKINDIFRNKYEPKGYTKTLCLCVRNKEEFLKCMYRSKKTSELLFNQICEKNTIIIDWEDLYFSFKLFKERYNNLNVENIDVKKQIFSLKFHQQVSVDKAIYIKNNGEKHCLFGHIPRSGKTYIIAGTILKDTKNDENYFIITPCPNETKANYIQVFSFLEKLGYTIIDLNGKNKTKLNILINKKGKNIIICSKQFLQTKSGNLTQIKVLKELNFSIRFLDETHHGESTELTKQILNVYGEHAFTVFVTATYSKPVNNFQISQKNCILWDLEDVKLCKNIDNFENKQRLIQKHGKFIEKALQFYQDRDIMTEYNKYPDLVILTEKITDISKKEIIDITKDNNYGWSCYSCLALKQDNNNELYGEFKDEQKVKKLFYSIFGDTLKFGIQQNESYIQRISQQSEKHQNLLLDCPVILIYLPVSNGSDIDLLSRTLISVLEKTELDKYYTFGYINGKKTNRPLNDIIEYSNMAKNSNKKGTIIFSGKQCTLGVTIPECDVVIQINNTLSFDTYYQSSFRTMTERENKKLGFVIDLNIHRVLQTIYDFSNSINRYNNPKKNIQYVLEQKLITLDTSDIILYENKQLLSQKIYNYIVETGQISDIIKSHFDIIDKIEFKFDIETLKKLEKISKKILNPKIQKQIILDLKKNNIKDGLVIKKIRKEENKEEENKEEEQILIEIVKKTFISIFKTILVISSILTINEEIYTLTENINFILKDTNLTGILYSSLLFSTGIDKLEINELMNFFISGYINYMEKETREIQKLLISLIKESKKDIQKLSELIDTYLIPTLIEKKINAEISTPKELRKEMLDTIPKEFWKTPRKVFEPCCGKGGFVIDIIDRFMDGLKEKYPNKEKRYRVIIEECLYFGDINPLNIYIVKFFINSYGKNLNINHNEGNTLELDITKKWGISGFDAVIGNPPYNKNLYKKFIQYLFGKYNFLLFVIPSSITIGVSHSKFMKELKDNGLKNVNYVKKELWKKNIDIETIYLLLKKNYTGDIKINNINIERQENIFNIDKNYIKIIEKLKNYNKLELFKGKNKTLNYKNPQETNSIKFNQDNDYNNKILSRLNGGKGEQIYYTHDKGYISEGYKLLLPRGTGSYNSKTTLKNTQKDLVYSKISKESILLSTGIVYFKCRNLKEAEFFKWYILRSKFVRFLFIKENKFSELTKGFVKLIPFIDYKKCNKTNYSIYNYLKLSEEEIKLIEETVN